MNLLAHERELKLSLLGSIARSQEALAKMLETAAEVTAETGVCPAVLHEHIRSLDGMQAALVRATAGTGWRSPKRGRPVKPWLNHGVHPGFAGRRVGGAGSEIEDC